MQNKHAMLVARVAGGKQPGERLAWNKVSRNLVFVRQTCRCRRSSRGHPQRAPRKP
jgi:hypothetical protein